MRGPTNERNNELSNLVILLHKKKTLEKLYIPSMGTTPSVLKEVYFFFGSDNNLKKLK